MPLPIYDTIPRLTSDVMDITVDTVPPRAGGGDRTVLQNGEMLETGLLHSIGISGIILYIVTGLSLSDGVYIIALEALWRAGAPSSLRF